LYVPQEQSVIAGALSFQTLERLLSLLALEVFLFGTAMILTSFQILAMIATDLIH